MSLILKKKGYENGTVRDYGPYGTYKKTEEGWIRLKKGYPKFRRTLQFERIKQYLLTKGIGKGFILSRNTKQLRKFMKSENMYEEFEAWNEEENNG